MGYFKDVTPESAGISSKGILNFLDRIEENQIELHSFMVIRHGQCAAKGWWKPYDEKFRHPLYSFSKSLTATAIGFAEQEGILSLDEKIVDIFPDLLPDDGACASSMTCSIRKSQKNHAASPVDYGLWSRDGDYGQFRKLDFYLSSSSGAP